MASFLRAGTPDSAPDPRLRLLVVVRVGLEVAAQAIRFRDAAPELFCNGSRMIVPPKRFHRFDSPPSSSTFPLQYK